MEEPVFLWRNLTGSALAAAAAQLTRILAAKPTPPDRKNPPESPTRSGRYADE
jgi:hypothetical protein